MNLEPSASPYAELISELDQQLARTARFVRAAFHVHSVDSYDWGKDGDPQRNERGQFAGASGQDRFLDELAAAGLQLVCITDHMRSEYACQLAERAASRTDITVLPGMEISCSVPPGHRESIHVLVAFPVGTTPDLIERLFADTDLPGAPERTGHEHVRFASLKDIRDRVERAHGIFVLAHIDQQPRGHRCYVRSVRGETAEMFGVDPAGRETITDISNEYAEHLVGLDPHALEVMYSADRQHYWGFHTADGKVHSFPCVARSDHHSVERMSSAEAVTHIKLSRGDLGCVTRALAFHETRLRFTEDLPDAPSPRLLGMRLRSSGEGLFKQATIAFNENLNCLIGPRGSGKSTIIEALRYVLGQRSLLEEIGVSDGESGSYAGLALATQNANLRDCEIELVYVRDGVHQVLAATFDPEASTTTRVFTLDGTDSHVQPLTLPVAFPASIFSWGELETLGRQPRLQRTVLDRLVDGLPALQQHQQALREQLSHNRRRIAELRRELARLLAADNSALQRYSEHKAAYERLNTPEVAALFADLDRLRARIDALNELEGRLADVADRLTVMREHALEATGRDLYDADDQELVSWWQVEVESMLKLQELSRLLNVEATALLGAMSERREALALIRDNEQREAEQAEAALREQTHADPGSSVRREQREQARRQFERARELRDQYTEGLARLESEMMAREQLLLDLRATDSEISQARQETAEALVAQLGELVDDGQKISIEVVQGGDRSALERYLDDFLDPERGGHYRARRLAHRLAVIDPEQLVAAIIERQPAELVAAMQGGITEEEAMRLVEAFDIYPTLEGAETTGVSEQLDELLELQEQSVEDLVSIRSDGRPVHELSPGGRSSAMLPLIALSDTVPLVIDQPEDNLDNRMVGRTLSRILARLKEHRQIIVTTHNPNIVVGGDAEQVIVLDAPTARSATVEETGSIDDDTIIDAVIKIMEGGREAFEERHRRYRARLQH